MSINGNKPMKLKDGKILYDDLAERIQTLPSGANIVMVQDQQPALEANKVWLTETPPAGVEVPTYGEFTGVIAPDYADLDFPVSAGEHCIHNGVLYTAIQNINASEAWTVAHWEAGSISSELTNVKTAIQGKYTKPSGGIPATDLEQAVRTSLGNADTAYQKPSGGIPASDIADDVIPVVDNALSDSSENAVQNKVVKGALDTKAPVIINTATGNPAAFNDGGGMPIKSLLIQFTPKQTGSGDPSPSNIRPIVPWDGLTFYGGGKNLYDEATYPLTQSRLIWPGDGTSDANANYAATIGFIPCENIAGKKITLNKRPGGSNPGFAFYTAKNTGSRFAGYANSGITAGTPWTITVPDGAKYMRFTVPAGATDIQLEAGDTATAYEPYKPITETDISFHSPVYGGKLDVVSGVLTVGYIAHTFTANDALYQYGEYTGGIRINTNILDNTKVGGSSAICNIAQKLNSVPATIDSLSYRISDGTSRTAFFIPDSMFDDGATVDKFKEWLSENEFTICAELETPQEIQLTPAQLTALIGNNTIWSDADGSMIVEYPADTALFIANQHRNFIAPELSSMIADTALVKNDFRIVGNNLYKITTAIASGGTLTPNTNCVKTTLAEVIKPLLT